MQNKIRIGLIGAGLMGNYHLQTASIHPEAKIEHISDVRFDVAKKLADEFNVKKVSKDSLELLSDKNVDMVIIALPTYLHHKWIIESAKAGKHILTEKPICRYVHEAKEVVEYCRKKKVIFNVGNQRRFYPDRVKIKEIIQSGKLGNPISWNIYRFGTKPDITDSYKNKWCWDEKGGGWIMEAVIHDFDFACWVFGEPKHMFCQSTRIYSSIKVPTQAKAIIYFKNGNSLQYGESLLDNDFGSYRAPICIVGPKGTIVSTPDMFSFVWNYAPKKKKEFKWDSEKLFPDTRLKSWAQQRYYHQLDNFIKKIKEKKYNQNLATGEEAIMSLWIIENILNSGAEGKNYYFK